MPATATRPRGAKNPIATETLTSATFSTTIGWMTAVVRGGRLVLLTMGHPSAAAARRAATRRLGAAPQEHAGPDDGSLIDARLEDLTGRLRAHVAGTPTDYDDIALDLGKLTPFQRKVVARCRQIGWGETITYGELAQVAGAPRAARAVGNTMAANRFPLIVPCHRVLPAGRGLGGFSAPQGVNLKQRLLDLEATTPSSP